jgi:hypothetical protein
VWAEAYAAHPTIDKSSHEYRTNRPTDALSCYIRNVGAKQHDLIGMDAQAQIDDEPIVRDVTMRADECGGLATHLTQKLLALCNLDIEAHT